MNECHLAPDLSMQREFRSACAAVLAERTPTQKTAIIAEARGSHRAVAYARLSSALAALPIQFVLSIDASCIK